MATQYNRTLVVTAFSVMITFLSLQSTFAQVSIGINGCYNLGKDESQGNPSQKDLLEYDKLKPAEVQSYINKLIVSTNNRKYFSFVLADLTEAICKKVEKDKEFTIVEKSNTKMSEATYYFYKIKETSGVFLNKVVYKQPELTNSIMVDVVSKNEADWNSFYQNRDAFIKKLGCAQKK